MNKIIEKISNICPEGVEYQPLWKVTIWDKKFNGVEKAKQNKVINYKYYLSADFDKVEREDGDVKYIQTGITKKERYTTEELAQEYLAEGEIVCIPWGGTPNVKYYKGKFVTGDNRIATSVDTEKLSNKFLYYWLEENIDIISSFYRGSGIKHPSMKNVLEMRIPIPPIEIQNQIVYILDQYKELTESLIERLSTELTDREEQYKYYKNFIFSKDIPKKKLGDIGQVKMCKRILKHQTNTEKGIPFYKIGTFGKKADAFISEELYTEYINKYNYPKKGDILISCSGTIGRTVVYNGEPAYFQDSNIVWLEHDESLVLNQYLKYCYSLNPWSISAGGTIARLYNDNILKAEIPVPTLKQQQEIINLLNKMDIVYDDLMKNLTNEIDIREKQYEYYRNKLLTFKELKINE